MLFLFLIPAKCQMAHAKCQSCLWKVSSLYDPAGSFIWWDGSRLVGSGSRSKGNDFRHHAKKSERQQRVFAASKLKVYISPHVFKLSWDWTLRQLCSLIGSYLLGSWSIVCYFVFWGEVGVLQHPCCHPVYDTTSSPIFRIQPIPFSEINGDLGRWIEMPVFGFNVDKC